MGVCECCANSNVSASFFASKPGARLLPDRRLPSDYLHYVAIRETVVVCIDPLIPSFTSE